MGRCSCSGQRVKPIDQDIRGPKGELVKIEMFVHGALCMAVSGKCYLSLHENNKSANRGECYQTCRKSYIATGKESGYELEIDNEYIMSPKDLCTIGFLDKLTNAGVTVLKIEGRARSAEYVRTLEKKLMNGKFGFQLFLTEVFGMGIIWDKSLGNGILITDQVPQKGNSI
jgi:collagenase-like PrtC family protease